MVDWRIQAISQKHQGGGGGWWLWVPIGLQVMPFGWSLDVVGPYRLARYAI